MTTNRKYKRTNVFWPSKADMMLGVINQSIVGTLKDITPYGAFFVPAKALFDNVPVSHSRYMKMIKTNDILNLKAGDLNAKAKVVWRGSSKEHNCEGVGLQFLGDK